MSRGNVSIQAFNRGRISPLALARTDIERVALSAETQTNWMPRVLGSMMLRPGLEHIGTTLNSAEAILIPFIFGVNDTALIEVSTLFMRVWVNDELVARPAVTAAVTNGAFTTDLAGWTDDDEAGATSVWATGGYMSLSGTGFTSAVRTQLVTCNESGTLHSLVVAVDRGPVTLRIGTTSGDDSYVSTELNTGLHSIAFTPTGNFYVQFRNLNDYASIVGSATIGSAGTLSMLSFWSSTDLPYMRWRQVNDIIYMAIRGQVQRKIERRANGSWSWTKYEPIDGPFLAYNQTSISMTPSATTGDITVTASQAYFKSTNVGSLFRLDSIGQLATDSLTAADQWTTYIRVTGVEAGRQFSITVSGTWTATVTLQRSIDGLGAWVDVSTYTGNTTTTYNDALDNQVVYYRIGIDVGDYTSGTAVVTLEFSGGSRTGIFKVTGYTSTTSVSARVIEPLGGLDASTAWAEGEWSDRRGWPTAVELHEGRLWWAGKGKVWASESDDFEVFNDFASGDAATIRRSIANAASETVHWLMSTQRLNIGTLASTPSVRSSSFDEVVTYNNINIKDAATQGTADIPPVKVDSVIFFVERSGSRIYQLNLDVTYGEYAATDVTTLIPEIGEPGIIRIGVQRQPDTRIHAIRSDGTVAMLISDQTENVNCWVDFETDGEVEDVAVLPGTTEDQVYYIVKRTIDGAEVRYIEKWAKENECIGGTLNKQLDAFITGTGSVTGLDHLEGEVVRVWGDGIYQGEFTVASGAVSATATSWVAGLPYTADWKSTKLAYLSQGGTALTQRKKVDHISLILANTHLLGLRYGRDFDNLDPLPTIKDGTDQDTDVIFAHYDNESVPFAGSYNADSRLCLRAYAPFPVTVLAAVVGMATSDKL